MPSPAPAYVERRRGASLRLALRGIDYHLTVWGEPQPDTAPLVLLHGWMDVGASFQFVVDALAEVEPRERWVVAPDWRGYGGSVSPPVDSYWFPDYLGDLDALLDALAPGREVDLVGHSMGGNVVMLYAGVRPQRVRRLVNLEGFGMPATRAAQAPARYAQWLDALKTPAELRSYPDLDAVAARLLHNNPRLAPERAVWLAPHWAERRDDGRWHLRADAAHKRVNPVLYRVDEVLEIWRRIAAPLLWVDGDLTDTTQWWGHRYPRDEFDARLAVVPNVRRHRLSPCGHMLHHDQPLALARCLAEFLT
ncbi:alpha/beta hydrolase [Azohydromonas sp.]|uniref:alpha/beta fold hydrolase n=1 Tax=Azohydromonas sp. TaxID=1872666 RepID=UPI002C328846|nr:alpha/beta hydrolase [Azohydromonas sp.]HMM85051.1 alpha/beta hydrolase [Azohydromonas sp.]